MRLLIAFTTILLSSSVALSGDKILKGQWGGDGISLWAGGAGADAGIYCSSGRITQPILLDEEGHFCVVGYIDYYDGTPPIQKLSATYIGDVVDDVMRLTVNMPGRDPMHFELRKDDLGKTYKCLE